MRRDAREFLQGLGDGAPKGGHVQLLARHADDLRRLRELIIKEAVKQSGKELAMGKIAGAAEDHQIKGSDLDDTRNHRFPLRFGWSRPGWTFGQATLAQNVTRLLKASKWHARAFRSEEVFTY